MAHVTRTILQVANQIQQHGQNGKIHRDGPGTKAAKGDQSSAEGCGHGPTSPENRLFFRSRKVKKPGHFLRRCLIKLGFFGEKTTPSSRFPGFCVESHPRSPTDQIFLVHWRHPKYSCSVKPPARAAKKFGQWDLQPPEVERFPIDLRHFEPSSHPDTCQHGPYPLVNVYITMENNHV